MGVYSAGLHNPDIKLKEISTLLSVKDKTELCSRAHAQALVLRRWSIFH